LTNFIKVVRQLQHERARTAKELDRLDAALAALNGSHRKGASVKRRLSAAARKRIAAAQRARWAKLRGNKQRKASAKAVRNRTLSAAARKKIAAAQRARWAKVKAAEEKKAAA
jgi:hypothetical protein